jgi:hypothetical protein
MRTFPSGRKTRILGVDDGGGYAVVNAGRQFTDQ